MMQSFSYGLSNFFANCAIFSVKDAWRRLIITNMGENDGKISCWWKMNSQAVSKPDYFFKYDG